MCRQDQFVGCFKVLGLLQCDSTLTCDSQLWSDVWRVLCQLPWSPDPYLYGSGLPNHVFIEAYHNIHTYQQLLKHHMCSFCQSVSRDKEHVLSILPKMADLDFIAAAKRLAIAFQLVLVSQRRSFRNQDV